MCRRERKCGTWDPGGDNDVTRTRDGEPRKKPLAGRRRCQEGQARQWVNAWQLPSMVARPKLPPGRERNSRLLLLGRSIGD